MSSMMKAIRIMTKLNRILFLFIGSIFLIACGSGAETAVEATQQVTVEGQEQVVTRVIRQMVTTTPAAAADGETESERVSLDISFLRDEPPELDPQRTDTPEGINLVENLFVGLTHFNHDTRRVEPELAREWQVSENGRVWTFHLRDDVFWMRPTRDRDTIEIVAPVVAADVVYAIQRVCARQTNTPDAVILFLIEGCEQIHSLSEPTAADLDRIGAKSTSDTTLEITLTKPAAHFLTITSLWMMRPVPGFLIEEVGDAWTELENLITSGPYYPSADGTALFWNPLWPLPRQGNVDVINISYLPRPESAFQLWDAKGLDIVPAPTDLTEEEQSRLEEKLRLETEQTLFYLAFNFDSGVFREPEMRRAFSAAIDREALIETVYGGRAVGMRHLVPPGVVGATPVDEVGMGYDPDFARIQLSESGFGSCKLMPPIRLLVAASDLSLQLAQAVRQMWMDELGCSEDNVIIEQAQFGTLLANTRRDAGAARPDIWELGWSSYYPDAHNWFGDLLHCADSENRQNRPCSEVDDLIRQAANTTDVAEREALYREIENMMFSREGRVPLIPLYSPGQLQLVQSWVTYTPAYFGGERYDTYMVDATQKRLERSR